LIQEAVKEATKLRFWYRKEYRLPINDERYLSITDEEIAIDYEASLSFKGEDLKECSYCHNETFSSVCPVCKIDGVERELTGDMVADNVLERLKAGEDVDLEEAFRSKSSTNYEVKS
jgi:hypothetical protein